MHIVKVVRKPHICTVYLPIQVCLLHALISVAGPSTLQSLPSWAGRGLVHVRDRY